jgi:Cu-Zn family superoxide dismutase
MFADATGVARLDVVDKMISLDGPHSILGRTMVVHADADDFGRGGHELSRETGNSGARLACGVIGLAQ